MSCTRIPRVAALHDISGFGRCALSVISPILSAMGVQVCPVPTAVLSTHTGGFSDFSFVDLTASMKETLCHYDSLGLQFDAIYSGFLGSVEQIEVVQDYISTFRRPDNIMLVDPVFADDGQLYETMTPLLVERMRKLICHADLITPNITEAAFLLEQSLPATLHKEQAEEMAHRLSQFGPRISVVTGVRFEDRPHCISSVVFDRQTETCFTVDQTEVQESYPGTGDVFASVLLGGLLQGNSIQKAMSKAAEFVYRVTELAFQQQNPPREGLPIEALLVDENRIL